MISLKINRDWKSISADNDTSQMNEPCAYRYGRQIHELFSVSDKDHLYRECDDGMGDELINDSEMYSLWDGDRFYTAAREINNA
jgi:hypothetical protein